MPVGEKPMPGFKPSDSATPQVAIADQIIVGFNEKLGALGMEAALARLEKLPAKILANFDAASRDDKAFFALAIIRYDGEKSLPELREQLAKDEHIAWVERNAPIAPALIEDQLFGQQWAL